jgi:hypothetical protein
VRTCGYDVAVILSISWEGGVRDRGVQLDRVIISNHTEASPASRQNMHVKTRVVFLKEVPERSRFSLLDC